MYLMMAVSLYKITVVCLCLVTISPQSKPKQIGTLVSFSHPSLGFNNQTGSNTTQAQVSSFINFINSASTFFRDDTRARLNYICDQMNKAYPIRGYGFSVVQQGNQSNFQWAINSKYNVYASVSAGVDKIFPAQSYMFNFGRVFFQSVDDKGSGITQTLQNVIKNTILFVEIDSTCICAGNVMAIASKLKDYDGGSWEVFCTNNYKDFALDVSVYNNKYIYIRPKNCYYGIYDM